MEENAEMEPVGCQTKCGLKVNVPLDRNGIELSEACALRKAYELEGDVMSREKSRNGNIMVWGPETVRIFMWSKLGTFYEFFGADLRQSGMLSRSGGMKCFGHKWDDHTHLGDVPTEEERRHVRRVKTPKVDKTSTLPSAVTDAHIILRNAPIIEKGGQNCGCKGCSGFK